MVVERTKHNEEDQALYEKRQIFSSWVDQSQSVNWCGNHVTTRDVRRFGKTQSDKEVAWMDTTIVQKRLGMLRDIKKEY